MKRNKQEQKKRLCRIAACGAAAALLLGSVLFPAKKSRAEESKASSAGEESSAKPSKEEGKAGGESETAKGTKEKLTFVLDWVPNTNHTGLYVAKEKGYFAEEGLELDIVQPAEESSATLVGLGRGQFGISFQPNMVKRIVKKVPVTAVAAVCQHNAGGILSLKESEIHSPKDLSGKRYSTWEDPIDDATVRSVVEADGGDWSKVKLVPGESTDAVAALRLKQFDAIYVYYGWDGVHAELEGVDHNFFYIKDLNTAFDFYTPVVIANNDFLKEKPETAKAALRAMAKGYEYAAAHPEEAAEILLKASPETDAKLVKKSQEYLSKQYLDDEGHWGKIDPARWNRFFRWVNDYKTPEGETLVEAPIPQNAALSGDFLPAVNGTTETDGAGTAEGSEPETEAGSGTSGEGRAK